MVSAVRWSPANIGTAARMTCLRSTCLFLSQFVGVLVVSVIGGLIIHACENTNEQTNNALYRAQREAWNSTLTQIHARALALVPADKQAQLAVDIANITAWAAKVTGVPDETNNW